MRDDELQRMLGGLATRLDEAGTPVDIEWVLSAPRQKGEARRAHYLLSLAALVLLIAAVSWVWRSPGAREESDVMSQSRAHVEVVGGSGPIEDGQSVEVAGTGFPADSEVTLNQCGEPGCDAWRPPVRVTTDADGGFIVDVLVFHDIATNRSTEPGPPVDPDWGDCEPCVLRAAGDGAAAEMPLDLEPTDQALHPAVSLPSGRTFAPGQTVTLEGTGFRPDPFGEHVGVTFCAAEAQDLRECGGGPPLGDFGVGADGRFLIPDLVLPGPETSLGGVRCADEPGACVVTWYLTSPGPLPAGIPLDLTGGGTP